MASRRSSALDRKIFCYPNWKYYKLTVAYTENMEMKKSESVNLMVEDFFNKNFSESQRQKMLDYFNKKYPDHKSNQ
jgi:hypothetical protein